MFHLYFANFHWTLWGLFVWCFVVFWLLWFFLVKILLSISVSLHCEFPVVDRLCLVLARQCRKKHQARSEIQRKFDATAEARKHKRDFAPTAFLRVTPASTVLPGNRLPDLPSASPTPETLPPTALALRPAPPSAPSAPSAQPFPSSQSASTRQQHPSLHP